MEKRRIVQLVSALLNNAYFKGFASLSIYQRGGKAVCVPVLNCYSCPGALGSCPVGAMQSFLTSYKHQLSLYVAGLLTVVGAATGRLVCGWLCPFGLIQELLNRIPSPAIPLPAILKYLKYLVLLLTLLLPVVWLNSAGLSSPYFCKFLCPAGTLEAGLPLGLLTPQLQPMLGSLFYWKLAVLFIFVLLSVMIFRPFCRVLCPLGAFYALFNSFSLWRLEVAPERCVSCGICNNICPMEIAVTQNPNDRECIRCMRCTDQCPQKAIVYTRITPLPVLDVRNSPAEECKS